MAETIRKRNGEFVPFKEEKILNAIRKANKADGSEPMGPADLPFLTEKVVEQLPDGTVPTVEQVQDLVEETLIRYGYAHTAKAYILYRAERTKIRDSAASLMGIYKKLTYSDAADEDIKRENANVDADTSMGTMLKYGSEGAKYFVLNYVLPKDIAKAHQEGDIHIHDMDFYMLTETCCQIDLLKLFHDGFSTGDGFVREPNSIRAYSSLACIAIQANQNEMHGGQSVPNFDYAMAEGIRKTYRKAYFRNFGLHLALVENMTQEEIDNRLAGLEAGLDVPVTMGNRQAITEKLSSWDPCMQEAHRFASEAAWQDADKETYQAMEALVANLNTMHSRAGAQVPFSSINYGTDTSEEGRMAVRNLLNATWDGLGNGETPIFPVQIFKVKEGVNFNPGDPNYDLFQQAIKTSAKRLFPNFSFLDAPFNLQYYREGDYDSETCYMGCRTRVMGNVYDPSKEVTCGRGNLSFTSINLPRLGIEAHGDVDRFFSMLDDRMDLVIRQLLHRFKIQCTKKVRNYPFLMGQGIWIGSEGLDIDDSVAEVLKHGTLSVGFIGLAETLKALTGKHHGESEESQELGLKIISHMRERLDAESQERRLNFTLLATPAEGLSGRFTRLDKERYGVIEGVTDREYYTNSFHVPVYYPVKAFKKIAIEAPYHALTNAGHISYVELDGDTCRNLKAFEAIIRYMKEQGIGYGSVNHPVDRDPVCGYTGVIGKVCPRCGRREGEGVSLAKLKELRRKFPDVPNYDYGNR